MNIQIFTNLKKKIRAFVAKENLNDLYVKKTIVYSLKRSAFISKKTYMTYMLKKQHG